MGSNASTQTYKISELIEEIAMGPFGSNIKVDCFVDEGVPVFNGSNLTGFVTNDKELRYVTEEKAESLGRALASRGDVVVTHRGTLGQIAYIPYESLYEHYIISQSQFRMRMNEKVLPAYLVYYFHTPLGQWKIMSNKAQTGVPALGRPTSTFQKIEIELPDIETQKKVVRLLDSIQSTIKLNQQTNDYLLELLMAQSKGIYRRYEASGDPLPNGWRWVELGEVTDLISRGITPKYADDSDQLILGQTCVRNNLVLIENGRKHQPRRVTEKWLRYGDLLINSTGVGSLGRTAQIWFEPENLVVDSHITIVRATDPALTFYLGFWAFAHERYIESLHVGSTGQTELPRDHVKAIRIVLPDDETLRRFNSVARPATECIVANQKESKRLAALRDALLPRLMSGEIDVSKVELLTQPNNHLSAG